MSSFVRACTHRDNRANKTARLLSHGLEPKAPNGSTSPEYILGLLLAPQGVSQFEAADYFNCSSVKYVKVASGQLLALWLCGREFHVFKIKLILCLETCSSQHSLEVWESC